jgi:hypothetical protein
MAAIDYAGRFSEIICGTGKTVMINNPKVMERK